MDWTVTEAAKEFGVSWATLDKGLRGIGLEPGHGKTFTTREVHVALAGDLKYETTRHKRNQADMLALEIKQKEGQLFSAELVQARIDKAFSFVRQGILTGRAQVPPRANPQDPKMALDAWLQWQDRFFPEIRERMKE